MIRDARMILTPLQSQLQDVFSSIGVNNNIVCLPLHDKERGYVLNLIAP